VTAPIARYWPLLLVLAAFGATAFVVPTLAPVATTDDWGYSRSVEILVEDGRLTVFPVVAATAVFQIGWGAAFALVLGTTLGVMRIATLAMVALGAVALYALLRELGVSRGRSALGTAVYLFNPLTFILAYGFMTDPYFTSLLIGSSYWFVRGLKRETVSMPAVIAGSALAACAFLTRQQGVLIPCAIGTYLLFTGQWRQPRLLAAIGGIPAAAAAGYFLWLKLFNDVPSVQVTFSDEVRDAGIGGAWLLSRNLLVIGLMYLGFFALPLAAALAARSWPALRTMGRYAWLAFALWGGVLAIGLAVYARDGKRWPYIPQFVGSGGLGPADVIGSRPRVFDGVFFDWATAICAVSAVLVALFVCRGLGLLDPDRRGAGIMLAIGLWQAAGVLPPSFHYIRRGFSLDRYLLPLLPVAICLLLWATKDLKLVQPAGWLVVAVFALFSVAATRDYLTFLDTVWETAHEATAAGVPLTKIDAGSGFDGYHLYTYGLDQGIERARTRGGPWWTYFYAKATDSSYIVSSKPKKGYVVVLERSYRSWLLRDNLPIYLLRNAKEPSNAALEP
jgi:hypothetical protein